MLSKLALALNQDLDYFLLDTQYAKRDRLIDEEIAEKLSRCNTSTLLTVNQMLDSQADIRNPLCYLLITK